MSHPQHKSVIMSKQPVGIVYVHQPQAIRPGCMQLDNGTGQLLLTQACYSAPWARARMLSRLTNRTTTSRYTCRSHTYSINGVLMWTDCQHLDTEPHLPAKCMLRQARRPNPDHAFILQQGYCFRSTPQHSTCSMFVWTIQMCSRVPAQLRTHSHLETAPQSGRP